MSNMKVWRVPKFIFMRKIYNLEQSDYLEIDGFLVNNSRHIKAYSYGRISGDQIFRITLADGTHRDWQVEVDMTMRRVPRYIFIRKMRKLEMPVHQEITVFMSDYSMHIRSYHYARVPGNRTYRIILDDNTLREWNVVKH